MQLVFIVFREGFPEWYVADVFMNRPLAEKFVARMQEIERESGSELRKRYKIQEWRIKTDIKQSPYYIREEENADA